MAGTTGISMLGIGTSTVTAGATRSSRSPGSITHELPRALFELHREALLSPVAHHFYLYSLAGFLPERAPGLSGLFNLLSADREDHVAGFQTGFCYR